MNNLFIAYYRVSTSKQGQSGLGLDSQKPHVLGHITNNGVLVGEFQDIESGTKSSREGFQNAIEACRATNATLVVYDISRLSRGGFMMMYELQQAGINFLESTSPNDGDFSKGIKFMVAKEERDRTSRNTVKALGEIKRKLAEGVEHISKAGNVVLSLGSPENLTGKAREKSIRVRAEKAASNPNNVKAVAFMKALKMAKDAITFKEMTVELNTAGFKTSNNNNWSQMQVGRIYKKYV